MDESGGLGVQRQKEPKNIETRVRGDLKLMAEESALNYEQKAEKLYTFRDDSIRLAAAILRGYNLVYEQEAEDIVSNAYVGALKHLSLGKFDHEATLQSWFTRIVINESLIFLRKQKLLKEKKIGSMPIVTDPESGGELALELQVANISPDPEQLAITNQERELLKSALSGLPSNYHKAIVLTEVEGMSNKEAAETRGVIEATQKTHKFRGIEELRKKKILQKLKGYYTKT